MRLLPFDYAARNAGRKPLRTVLTVIGAAGVVFLVILMGAFVDSLARTMRATGEPQNAIILGTGSENFLEQSEIDSNIPSILAASLRQVRKRNGVPLISPEVHHATVIRATAEEQKAGTPRTALVRGIGHNAFAVHRQVYIREGRPPGPGELLFGSLAAFKLGLPAEAARIGSTVYMEGRPWKISGIMEAPGTAFQAEVWAPLEDLKIALKRDTLTCAIVELENPARFVDVSVFCKSRLDLEISAVREQEYYGTVARFFRPMQILGWIMASLVVIAGLFGGLNTMIAAIASRARELACLETIGYSRRAIAVSLLQESILLVGTGSMLAGALASVWLSGFNVRMVMGAVSIGVTHQIILAGFAAGLVLAVAGTLLPAVRLFRTPLVQLLRS